MRTSMICVCLLSLVLLATCGGNDDDPFKVEDGGTPAATGVPANSTIKGKITFMGDVPPAKPLPTTADPKCMNTTLKDESVVVSDGGLENVIIFVSNGHQDKPGGQNTTEVLLDQMGCHYIPHALTIQTNQPLKIRNSDPTAHNVHTYPEANEVINLSQVSQGAESVKTFTKEEMLMPVQCDVHNWMRAFIGVFSHPYHTVSKTGGAFEFKVPNGDFEVTAIHEKYGRKTMMVTVADGATAELNFTFNSTDKAD